MPSLSSTAASAAAATICARLDGGTLDLFDDNQSLLARITLATPAFTVGDDGSADLQGTPLSGLVVQTGNPSQGRFSRSLKHGATPELDATVGVAADDPDIVTAVATLQVGSTARILGFTLSLS